VVWEDAHGSIIGDYTQEAAIREFKAPTIYKTLGILLHTDDKMTLVARDECVTDPGYRDIAKIPAGMVREIIHLPTPHRAPKRSPRRSRAALPTNTPAPSTPPSE
jgi:hypothetical protein